MSFDSWLKSKLLHEHKVKPVQNPGVIGHYESKPYHNFKYALIYANENNVIETEEVEVYTRVYQKTTFVNVLVNDDTNFDIEKYHYDKFKEILLDKGCEATDKSVTVVIFEHYNQNTVDQCRKFCNNNKNQFEQALVYNPRLVQVDYYRPVPKYMTKMYEMLMEDLYFDLAFIDSNMD